MAYLNINNKTVNELVELMSPKIKLSLASIFLGSGLIN